jgi:dethiobiotin synthetase
MASVPDLFVTGTDTGVGKTVVSLLIMQFLIAKGHRPFYLKLFQTGCDHPDDIRGDAKFIYGHTAALKEQDPGASVIYCYPEPRAPYYAAERSGEQIDLALVRKRIAEKRRACSSLVIEGAGGLLVPVTREKMVVDVIEELQCRPLLVARAGLGTINHTLLSLQAMRQRRIEPLGVVLVDAGPVPEKRDLVAENIEAIHRFGGAHVAGVIGRLTDCSRPPDSAYRVIERIFKYTRGFDVGGAAAEDKRGGLPE